MEHQRIVLIVSKPGIMRDSLVSYLRALPLLYPINIADDTNTASQMIREHQPDLMIVDSDLEAHEMLNLLQRTIVEHPAIHVIALVENLQQQQMCITLGARSALLKGFLDEQLSEAIRSQVSSLSVLVSPQRKEEK
jgi:DNA-binding NarL/FixJ family response regulator